MLPRRDATGAVSLNPLSTIRKERIVVITEVHRADGDGVVGLERTGSITPGNGSLT